MVHGSRFTVYGRPRDAGADRGRPITGNRKLFSARSAPARLRPDFAPLSDTLSDANDMTRSNDVRARLARRAAVLPMILLAVAGGCGDGSKHAPDGTTGVANPTGQPNVAGDTTSARVRDSSKGPNAGSPTGARP